MQKFKLELINGHLLIPIKSHKFILDTGAPASFGMQCNLTIEGREFMLLDNYMGLTAEKLSQYLELSVSGIIGADILKDFDIIIDILSGQISFSIEHLKYVGDSIETEEFLGIPIVPVNINDKNYRFFFDTGAKISYFQENEIISFPHSGEITDFYPGIGLFETGIYMVSMELGLLRYTVRCGVLPALLSTMLSIAGAVGILGNEILYEKLAYFLPRHNKLVLL